MRTPATGLGLNTFVAFGIAELPGMTWADAMGLVLTLMPADFLEALC
jgi:xanthine/uracil/vitamin C permease (AzgA family)